MHCERNDHQDPAVFFGAAIQGSEKRGERAHVHRELIASIKAMGFHVLSEHTGGRDFAEAAELMEASLGALPDSERQRSIFVRDEMIRMVESDIAAAVFEVSTPSLGTGIELAHAYLRPRLSLPPIPVIALYQEDYWPNHLSTMINGLSEKRVPHFWLISYRDTKHAGDQMKPILETVKTGAPENRRGVVAARSCPSCGHHEIGLKTAGELFLPLRPGMRICIE